MKRYSIIWIITVLMLAGGQYVHAQQPNDDAAEKIKALQVAYLAKSLDLTPDEAQKFWPVYNSYTREVEQLITERRMSKQQDKTGMNSDEVARKKMDDELGYEKRMLDIKSRYTNEFQRVLPPRKAGNVFKSEREFRNIMINHLNNQRVNRIGREGMMRGKH
ncbi:hypothetical protein [Chitinophaga vietnamensis]|uniref:hypothetical protein n=1 Tax=Chitinophaga vietnamensis TaxID=2593957 RepID=UPI0011784C2E|nr:hypothetical protein [Chitinophaga vietnamensis]